MSRWPAYSEYIESGIPWLGRIPAQWDIRRLKHAARINTNSLPEDTDPDYQIEYVDIGNVDSRGSVINIQEMRFENAPSRARRLVKDGDTIISTVRTYLKAIAHMDQPSDNLVVSTGFAVLRPEQDLEPRYLCRLVQSQGFVGAVIANSEGIGYPAIAPTKLAELPVWIPPLPEQCAIADFLDRERAQMDALVAKFDRLMALLEERRAALISHAVTKGLDPDVPMKDSGIPWLGEIPVGWSKVRVRHVARLESGHTPSRQHPEYWQDCTIPWFSLADVWQIRNDRNLYIRETKELVSELGLANSSARLLPKDTVILSRTASVGFSGIMDKPMATTQDFANWICGPRLAPEYLLFTFRAMRQELGRLTMGSTHQTIYMPDISELTIALPPREEQERIVQTIRFHSAMSYALDANTTLAISHLQEYRTALISAAVTGKIDVRDRVGRTCC